MGKSIESVVVVGDVHLIKALIAMINQGFCILGTAVECGGEILSLQVLGYCTVRETRRTRASYDVEN